MLLLAHHGPEAVPVIVALLTFGGPALLALRCWLHEQREERRREREHRH